MKRIILLVTVALLMTVFAGVAQAQPMGPPIGGPSAHPHHVHTGNDGCVDIDAGRFNADFRGLHRASIETGMEQGPFHSDCAEDHPHLPPGEH